MDIRNDCHTPAPPEDFINLNEADWEAAWAEETRRRLGEIDSGLMQTVPWAEVKARFMAL